MPRTTQKKAPQKDPEAPESGAALLARVKPRRRRESTVVCLRADLIAEWQTEDAKLREMQGLRAGNGNRLNPGTPTVEDAEKSGDTALRAQARKVRKIETQIEDSQTEFVFEQMNKDEWSALSAEFPPRKDNQVDHIVGYNRDEILDEMVRRCLIRPTFEDCVDDEGNPRRDCDHEECGTWQQLVKTISPSEWRELRDTANLANSGVVDPPKSVLASLILDRRASGSR